MFRTKPLFALNLLVPLLIFTPIAGQEKPATDKPSQEKSGQEKPTQEKQDKTVPDKNPATAKNLTPTGEQVAESVVFVYGSRTALEQIRRNGVERGRITRVTPEGRTEEVTYERRFVRGTELAKDKVRVDQKMPTLEYSLIYGEGKLWGIINGSAFTPRPDAVNSFMSQYWHSIDALLRYKESGSTVSYINKEKQKGIDVFVIDLTDKENRQTRYLISARSLHVLSLEYQENEGGAAVKYLRTFHDYRPAQSTWVPYRSVLWADGKQIQETRILTITFGLKLDDSLFQNPAAQASNP